MIRVIGFYRWKDGATFNHEYYNSEHMRVTKQALLPHGLLRLERIAMCPQRYPLRVK